MRKSKSHLRQMRRRMVWFYRAKAKEQVEDKPKPVTYYFEPEIADYYISQENATKSEHYAEEILEGIRKAKEDTDAHK